MKITQRFGPDQSSGGVGPLERRWPQTETRAVTKRHSQQGGHSVFGPSDRSLRGMDPLGWGLEGGSGFRRGASPVPTGLEFEEPPARTPNRTT